MMEGGGRWQSPGFPAHPRPGRRHRLRPRNSSDKQNQVNIILISKVNPAWKSGRSILTRSWTHSLWCPVPRWYLLFFTSQENWCLGLWHCSGALQCNSFTQPGKLEKMIFPGRKDYISACWEHGRDVHYRQWGSVRHLIPHSEAEHPDLWRPQPPDLPHHVRGHHLPEVIFIINSPDPPDQVINSVKYEGYK